MNRWTTVSGRVGHYFICLDCSNARRRAYYRTKNGKEAICQAKKTWEKSKAGMAWRKAWEKKNRKKRRMQERRRYAEKKALKK